RARRAVRVPSGLEEISLRGGGALDGGRQERKSAARDPVAAEVHEDVTQDARTLDETALGAALTRLPGWRRAGRALEKAYRFADFRAALAFVNPVGELAERQQHHPAIAF